MLRIHFTGEDIARTTLRAEPDPLWEALLSLHMLQVKDGPVAYGDWRRRQCRQLPREVVTPLTMLAPPRGYSPDFLTPSVGSATFEEAVELMRSTPRRRIRTELGRLTPQASASWPRQLAEARPEAMHKLTHSLRAYHRSALAPYWPAITAAVRADHVYRRAQLTSTGIGAVLESIHPEARWRRQTLEIAAFRDEELWLGGRGLELQPSYFCWRQPTKLLDAHLRPVLVFPIRGATGLTRVDGEPTDSHARLVTLLGRTRAEILARTATPATTGELAAACGKSAPAVSYQTGVLRESELITSYREGQFVVHKISELGRALLEGTAL